ncbi:MAG: mycofactocin-coupled SDR family oxidoreductase [Porticoccaceae bacterium]|nr:mycofactocin-coupled SDR family oxidoreductase [Porticoccaceae bacterium]
MNSSMLSSLQGQVALVTGGARGNGRAIARRLAQSGAAVTITDLSQQADASVPYKTATSTDLEATREMIEAAGGRCLPIVADVRSIEEMQHAVKQTIETFGRLDIVVANAGIFSGGVPAHQLSEKQWDLMMDVNVKGAWNTARAAIPGMIDAGRGCIVIISSVAGIQGGTSGFAHYVTAKHAVVGLTRALATELGPRSIRVNAVAPTMVDTPMTDNQFYYDLFTGGPGGTREGMLAVLKGMHLLPVPGVDPEDIGNAVNFLASDEARYVHGIVLPVDAGLSINIS